MHSSRADGHRSPAWFLRGAILHPPRLAACAIAPRRRIPTRTCLTPQVRLDGSSHPHPGGGLCASKKSLRNVLGLPAPLPPPIRFP